MEEDLADDLFAVFDSDSSKSKRIVISDADEGEIVDEGGDEENASGKYDSGQLVAEICGAKREDDEVEGGKGGKRSLSGEEEMATEKGEKSKKIKVEDGMTLMTGLTDKQGYEKMEPGPAKMEDEKTLLGVIT